MIILAVAKKKSLNKQTDRQTDNNILFFPSDLRYP